VSGLTKIPGDREYSEIGKLPGRTAKRRRAHLVGSNGCGQNSLPSQAGKFGDPNREIS